uniref:ABC transporter domain-containing protein n=1 Tax=Trichobilharzia regenti TaxID=157069 RepID=A0AA85IS00_TRIRE|nr:unnamed protein product [Trichobilharzia regenti]
MNCSVGTSAECQALSPNPKKITSTTLSFHNISYSVKNQTFPWSSPTHLKVISDLSGYMPPGMNAIIGPTGCGKSTLLDVLAGRKNPLKLSGYILLNGQFIPSNVRRRLCGYVVQENIAMDTLTIRENITFSASLRSPRCTTSRQREAKVSSVIEELGLSSVADRILGNQLTRGISAGERKRTCIGIELVNDPLVLYLDEPTTGLDAYTAGTVIQTLRRLADSGRTVVFSIHQPKYSIYRQFDRLTILSGGQMIYHGPADKSPIVYFESCGYLIEGHNNPADFFMDILHGEVETTDTAIQQANISDTNKSGTNCKTLRETVRCRLISLWLESTLWQQCKAFLAECCVNSNENTQNQSKKPKVDRIYKPGSSNPSTTGYNFYQNKAMKFRKKKEQCTDCDLVQPGNYLSSLNRDIKRFDELWALSRSVNPATTTNTTPTSTIVVPLPDDNNDEHSPIIDVEHEMNDTPIKSTAPGKISESQLMRNQSCHLKSSIENKLVNSKKILGCCQLSSSDGHYQQCETSFCHQFVTLNWRSYLNLKRSWRTILSHFIIQLIIALFLGIIYLNMDKWRESGIQNRMGLFFFTCVHLLFISGALLEIFLKDRIIFMHETSAGFYRISTYFLSKIISDVLPSKAIPALLCLSITYFLSGLRYELRPFLFWELTITLLTFSASAITFAVSAMVKDHRIGSMLLSMFFVLMMITSGYLVNIPTLWRWLQLVRYISILRYAINILAINELFDMKFCPRFLPSSSKLLSSIDLNSINISDPIYANLTSTLLTEWQKKTNSEHFRSDVSVNIQNLESICITGVQYLESQAVDYQSNWAVWLNELGIFVIAIVALCVAYFHLRLIKRYK